MFAGMAASRYLRQTGLGLLASATIGLPVPVGCNLFVGLWGEYPALRSWDRTDFGIAILVAVPFVLLSLFGVRTIRAWGAGPGATPVFRGTFYLPSLLDGGGASIGFGLLAPLSPVFIFVVALPGLLPEAARDDR